MAQNFYFSKSEGKNKIYSLLLVHKGYNVSTGMEIFFIGAHKTIISAVTQPGFPLVLPVLI